MFLEYLPEPVAQWFGSAAGALDDKDFVASRAFARRGHAHLECRDEFRLDKHFLMLPQIRLADITWEGTSGSLHNPRRWQAGLCEPVVRGLTSEVCFGVMRPFQVLP